MAIVAADLTKVFRMPDREKGVRGALKHIVYPKYKDKLAVDRVNFRIEDGETVAYIGPNGAGKSTTIKMLTGILQLTGGRIEVQGVNPYQDRIANTRNIGVVFGQRTQLWWDIPVEESFRLLKDIYEIKDARYRENLALFGEVFGLSEFISRSARKLSLGQRMRADLAAALLHDPKVLFLDEPTIGLDISVKESMRRFIQMVNRERGTTVILTSHDLKDVEDLCRRVIVIDEGRIVCDAQLDQLSALYAHERTMRVSLKRPCPALLETLQGQPGVSAQLDEDFCGVTVTFDVGACTAYELIRRIGERAEVGDMTLIEPDIKRVIERIYRSELRVSGP